MKNKKRYLSVLIMSLLLFSGCQLALEGKAGDSSVGDRFVGVFITRGSAIGSISYKDTELEAMTEEERAELPVYEYNSSEAKVYADFSEEDKTYVFDHEGNSFFSVSITENDQVTYTSLVGDGVSDSSSHFSVGADEEKTELEGTIYYSSLLGEVVWYFNPVYQEGDGDVYAIPSATGVASSGETGEGLGISQWKEEVKSVTTNGQTKSVRTHVKVSFSMMYNPERIKVFEMGENSQILKLEEYVPGQLPKKYSPDPDTVYLMVETHKKGPEGSVVTREIFDKTKDNLETFYAREDGIIARTQSELMWKK